MKKVITALLFLVPALSTVQPVFAEIDDEITAKIEQEIQQFELLTNCQPVYLLVENLGEDAKEIRLTKSLIVASAESRLRSAHIYTAKPNESYLYINVNVSGTAFNITITFKKTLHDHVSSFDGFGVTWNRIVTGTHGGNGMNVLPLIGMLMDEFLVEYLRVNEKACENLRLKGPGR